VPASAADLSTVDDGVRGLAFVAATLRSSAASGQWTPIESDA
jgi:hypothetical protein